jgi:hypothetical protein
LRVQGCNCHFKNNAEQPRGFWLKPFAIQVGSYRHSAKNLGARRLSLRGGWVNYPQPLFYRSKVGLKPLP